MNARLQKLEREICVDMFNVIFSPALADGPTRCDSPDGQKIGQSGRQAVRASRSVKPENNSEKKTNDTSGLSCESLFASADLQLFSASKSQAQKHSEDYKKRDREYQRVYRQRNRARDLIRHARFRSHKKKIAFDLDHHIPELQKRIDTGFCEVTGLPFRLDGGRTWDSPSLDRIEPTKGYIYENVRVVCHAVNSALGDWGEQKLLEIAEAITWRRTQRSNELSRRLGEALKRRLSAYGSTEFELTWSECHTPSGHLYYRLRASVRRKSDSDSTGWPSPCTPNGGRSMSIAKMDATGRTMNGKKHTASLEHAVKFSGWPTPRTSDTNGAGNHGDGGMDLRTTAKQAGWATPTVQDSSNTGGGITVPQEQPATQLRGNYGFWSNAIWHQCRDGKARRIPRPEPGVLLMDDGFFYSLADVRSTLVTQAKEEIEHYAKTARTDRNQVLQVVQQAIDEEAVRKPIGGQGGVYAEEILLDFLRDLLSALNRTTDGSGSTETRTQNSECAMRDLRIAIKAECSSYRRESEEQFSGEPSAALLVLSQFLARCCKACRDYEARQNAASFPLSGKVAGRVALLRGAGNAIVPPLAAEFIGAVMEIL